MRLVTRSRSLLGAPGLPFSIIAIAAAAFVAGAGGCYKPDIKNGGFVCGDVSMYKQLCPQGFHCESGVCKNGPVVDAAIDLASEARPPDATPDKTPTDVVDSHPDQNEVCVPPPPVAGCTPDPGKKCDPFCQSGCGCEGKCSVNTLGDLTCNQPAGTLRRKEGEGCDPVSPGTSAQTDNCEPGLVCYNEACGNVCARFCRTDQDCPNSTCSRDAMSGYKVCDVPLTDCNPVKSAGSMKCSGTAVACYLSPTAQDRTICDCPGSQKEGEVCSASRDCFPGLACVDALGVGMSGLRCQIVCSLTATPNGCVGAQMCRVLKGSKVYGYCF